MDKEENFSAGTALPENFSGLDYSIDYHHHHQQPQQEYQQDQPMKIPNTSEDDNQIVDYMFHNPPGAPILPSAGYCSSSSPDKLSFADVMQFSDFGPKLALNQTRVPDQEDVYFLKFPVLNDKLQQENGESDLMMHQGVMGGRDHKESQEDRGNEEARVTENSSVQLRILGENVQKGQLGVEGGKNKRKRPRTIKTSEEVESQRMTHIAVERNRRKQMNEHLRVLRTLMPGSYVQRGDQASIIGGAIEFVRELEQLLQCLESQKRRRLYGDAPPPPRGGAQGDPSTGGICQQQPPPPPFFPPMTPLANDQLKVVEFEGGVLREETAESKSCLADVEVKMLGFDAIIKILSRRRPGQLIKTLAALEDLQLTILHTNITTIEQTVLYSFNVKVAGEVRFSADDIANSVQQIFSFIHASI